MEKATAKAIKDLIGESWRKLLTLFYIPLLFIFFYYAMLHSQNFNWIALLVRNCIFGTLISHAILNNTKTILDIHLYFKTKRKTDGCSSKVGCTVCDGKGCTKDPDFSQEPWSNILIDYRLDRAIQEFYEAVLREYVCEWYLSHSENTKFIDELRMIFKYSSSILYKRLKKVHFGELITRKLVPCGLNHLEFLYEIKRNLEVNETVEEIVASKYHSKLHPAIRNRESELEYLRNVTTVLMPVLLKSQDLDCHVSNTVIREIFAGWVLMPLLDLIADPNTINTLLIELTNGEKMLQFHAEPELKVEFLHQFVRNGPKEYHNTKLLKFDVEQILQKPPYLYAFMQFMKNCAKVHILQFCLDIDAFNRIMLNPDLTEIDQIKLFKKAEDIFKIYFSIESPTRLNFKNSVRTEMQNILRNGPSYITQLQTSQSLFEAYEYALNLLEDVYAPKFYHSEEFYSVFFGSRTLRISSPNTSSESFLESNDKPTPKVGLKIKDALKGQAVDGHTLKLPEELNLILDSNLEEFSSENDDIDLLKCLEILGDPSKYIDKNMSAWLVSIEDVYEREMDSDIDYIFVLDIQSAEDDGNWKVKRNENDFHILKIKLLELHEEQLQDISFPSLSTNIPVDIKVMQYEEFIRKLLHKQFFSKNELLFLFLTTDEDFAFVSEHEKFMPSGAADLNTIYESVAEKLRKEGQHLTPFLHSFIMSTGVTTFQNKKNDEIDDGQEAETVEEKVKTEDDLSWPMRDITGGIFKNNFNINQPIEFFEPLDTRIEIEGFCDCFTYFVSAILKLPTYIHKILSRVFRAIKVILDPIFDNYLNNFLCNLFCQARWAHLITLGHEILFLPNDKTSLSPSERKTKAKDQLNVCFSNLLVYEAGRNLLSSINDALEMLQSPQLNKQLAMSLFDIVVIELFPEVAEIRLTSPS